MSGASTEQLDKGPDQPTLATRTFDIPELLEKILLQLPVKHLLVHAQRVCRTWRMAVTHSIKLQRALFLVPIPDEPVDFIGLPDRENRYAFVGNGRVEKKYAFVGKDCNVIKVLQNPYYNTIISSIECRTNKAGAYGLTEASWRRMLVTQPPLCLYARRMTPPEGTCYFGFHSTGVLRHSKERLQKISGLVFEDIERMGRSDMRHSEIYIQGQWLWEGVEYGHEVKVIRGTMA